MIPNSRSVLIVDELIRLRRRIAPPGSLREVMLRACYVPLVNMFAKRALRNAAGGNAEVHVTTWDGLGAGAAPLPQVTRILVLKLDHLGDFVLGLPACEQLRAAFPAASITLVCGSWNCSWAGQSGLFDKVIGFDFYAPSNSEWRGVTPARIAAFKELGLGSFDLAIDLRHDPETRILLPLVDAKFRAGFCAPADGGGAVLDIALPNMEHVSPERGTGRPVHAELRLLLLAHAVIGTLRRPPHPATRLLRGAAGGMAGGQRYAVLAPGAGSPIREWPLERFAAVGKALCERYDIDVVITGGSRERAAGQALAEALPAGRARNLVTQLPLADLPGLIDGASLYVGLDAGTTHLAASLGVPTVAITSGVPELEVWHATGQHVRVVAGQTACSPCYLVQVAQCPFGVACLNAITVAHVMAACDALLRGPAAEQAAVTSGDGLAPPAQC